MCVLLLGNFASLGAAAASAAIFATAAAGSSFVFRLIKMAPNKMAPYIMIPILPIKWSRQEAHSVPWVMINHLAAGIPMV